MTCTVAALERGMEKLVEVEETITRSVVMAYSTLLRRLSVVTGSRKMIPATRTKTRVTTEKTFVPARMQART